MSARKEEVDIWGEEAVQETPKPKKEKVEKVIKLVEDEIKKGLEEAKKKRDISEKWEKEVIL